MPLLPKTQLAMQMADIENAASKIMPDPEKTNPIRERINKMRLADKERLTARIRRCFIENNDLLTEEDILTLWREITICEVVHNS